MIRRTTAPVLALALAFTLAACGGADEPESQNAGEQSKSAEATPEKDKKPEPVEEDRTEDLQGAGDGEAWAKHVTSASQNDSGRLTVLTDLADRRGKKGKRAVKSALRVCEEAVRLLEETGTEEPRVYVMDKDATLFAVAGHPGYPEGCSKL